MEFFFAGEFASLRPRLPSLAGLIPRLGDVGVGHNAVFRDGPGAGERVGLVGDAGISLDMPPLDALPLAGFGGRPAGGFIDVINADRWIEDQRVRRNAVPAGTFHILVPFGALCAVFIVAHLTGHPVALRDCVPRILRFVPQDGDVGVVDNGMRRERFPAGAFHIGRVVNAYLLDSFVHDVPVRLALAPFAGGRVVPAA